MPFVRGSWMRGVAVSALAVATMGAAGCSTIMHPLGGGNGPKQVTNPDSAASIGVNGYLWRATLDTLSFMPLASADPYGGVVITDWYTAPQVPNERMKVTVYILDRALRADGLKVAVFRQTKTVDGWADATVASDTSTRLEDAILTRARELRLASGGS